MALLLELYRPFSPPGFSAFHRPSPFAHLPYRKHVMDFLSQKRFLMHSLCLLFLETACSLLADARSHWQEDPELIMQWDCCPAKQSGERSGKFLCMCPLERQPSHNESRRKVFLMMDENQRGWQERAEGNRELFSNYSFWQGRTTDTQGCASNCCLLLTARYRSTSVPRGLGPLLGYRILRQRHELSPPIVAKTRWMPLFFFFFLFFFNKQWKKVNHPYDMCCTLKLCNNRSQ